MYKCWVFNRRVYELEWTDLGLGWGLGISKRFERIHIGLFKWRLTLDWSRLAECGSCGFAVPVPSDVFQMCTLSVVSDKDEMVEPDDYCEHWTPDRGHL